MDAGHHLLLRAPGMTREHSLKIEIPIFRHLASKRFFVGRVMRLWNSVPEALLSYSSSNEFRRVIKAYIPDPILY